ERAREHRETLDIPDEEAAEVAEIFQQYGLNEKAVEAVVGAIRKDRKKWVDFMLKFELGLDKPDPRRATASAITIAVSYIIGGLVPLSPYFFVHTPRSGLLISVIFTLAALLVFG